MGDATAFVMILVALVGLVLLAAATWAAWAIITFLIIKLPRNLSQGGTWTAWLAVVLSLAILPGFTASLLDVGNKAVTEFGELLRTTLQLIPRQCDATDYCPSLSTTLSQLYGNALNVISGLGVPHDLLLQLPGFIVLAVIINFGLQLVRALLQKEGTSIFGSLVASSAKLGTSKLIVNGLFTILVLLSMYLSLAALLAVPLMQPQAVVDGFGVEDLQKNLPTDADTQNALGQRFPVGLLPPIPSNLPDQTTTSLRQASDQLDAQWTTVRVDVIERIRGLRLRAIEDFRGQNALGFGGKGPVNQYVRTYNWYWAARNTLEAAAEKCALAVKSLSPLIRGASTPTGSDKTDTPLLDSINLAMAIGIQTCSAAGNIANEPLPERTKPGDSLKAVGIWTDWLIGTESMPLVIIVGLVGFSLLGASISHLIVYGRDPDATDLSLGDFLRVVVKGAVAALTVFLASYGGLAVLGNVPQDPSPYVVFALCLVAAVFSDDVWTWARDKLLTPALKGEGDPKRDKNEAPARNATEDMG